MISSFGAEVAFDKIHHLCRIKTLNILGTKGNNLNLEGIYEKPKANVIK